MNAGVALAPGSTGLGFPVPMLSKCLESMEASSPTTSVKDGCTPRDITDKTTMESLKQ